MKVALILLFTRTLRWRPGDLMHHGSVLLVWMLLRAAAQTGIVVLLARQLGAQAYGQFVAIIAVASIFTPFVGLGLSNMVLRNAARDPVHEAIYFARAARWWWRSWLPCLAVAVIAAIVLLPTGLPFAAVCAVVGAELLTASLVDLRARHQQAQQNTHAYGAINAGLPAIRLLAFGAFFVTIGKTGATDILWIYAASSLLYSLLVWRPASSQACSSNTPGLEPMTVVSGLPFSLAAFAVKLQGEFNKPLLAQSGFGLAGTYNVAQRAVDMASLPLLALQESLWPRLYAQQNPLPQLRRTGLVLLVLALALGCALWLAAPLLPWLVGPSYESAVTVLRMLAWLPLLQVFRALLNFQAIHHGYMPLIGWACAIGAAVSVAGVMVLVPMLGMEGALLASYTAEAAMIAYLFVTIRQHVQRHA
jgi:O-antigen/teichoic acid export membrane protein